MNRDDPMLEAVERLVAEAARSRAAAIHLEPEHRQLRVRLRIDGRLHDFSGYSQGWVPEIVPFIKSMAGLDPSLIRLPQEGRFRCGLGGQVTDIEVATLPTAADEQLLMRLSPCLRSPARIEDQEFSVGDLMKFQEILSLPFGMIVFAGAGAPENICRLINQAPNILDAGEMTGGQTCRSVFVRALTGQRMLASVSAADTLSALETICRMGIEPFWTAAAVAGLIAQRTVRAVCPQCRVSYQPSEATIKKWHLAGKRGIMLFRGQGCPACRGTGYCGCCPLNELLVLDDELKEAVASGAGRDVLRRTAQRQRMSFLSDDGLAKALAGMTTLDEVQRYCPSGRSLLQR